MWQEVFATVVALIETNMTATIPETTAPFRGWARRARLAISLMREQRFARGKDSLVGLDSGCFESITGLGQVAGEGFDLQDSGNPDRVE